MRPKRILLIIPEMSMGGAQRSLSKLSIELARHHWVGLVIFNKNDQIAYAHGGELISLNVVPGSGFLSKLKSFFLRILRLRRLKRELNIDVSISFLEGADYINILSRTRDKIVLSIRGSKIHDEILSKEWTWLRKKILIPWLYQKAALIVTVNDGIARELKTYYRLQESKIVTIGNYYDIAEILRLSEAPKEENLQRFYSDKVLITTGRLAPEKGLRAVIRIFHGLKKEHENLRLVMVGDGEEHQALIRTCVELDLKVARSMEFTEVPDVLFAGNQSNVFRFLKGATLYLMNSSSEGFPNGLAEAMICGIPAVSSDCPYGPREILAPEFPYTTSVKEPYASACGIVMPMIDSEDILKVWIQTVGTLLADENRLAAFAARGQERMGRYDAKLVASSWHQIIDDGHHE